MTGTHLNKLGTQQKKRIYFEVSKEAAKMWEEIVSHEKKRLKKTRDTIQRIQWKN
ncbi:hypothetical protein [Enterococcus faecalis]|uniref:hypothetical protein n=1 Tax=Enterococcus faecalis TaxID=1351 RepID=UPI002737EBB5|nr:hypothetical protein [Enterococcus faecalis]